MTNTRQIAEEVMAYSKAHENDALSASEPNGDMKYIGWETPYYCYSIEELEDEITEDGYTTTKEAIKGMTEGFKMHNEYSEDIRGA